MNKWWRPPDKKEEKQPGPAPAAEVARKDELKAAMSKLREWVRVNGRTG